MTAKRFKLAPLPPKLKQFTGTLAKYTPLLRTTARIASFASSFPGLKALRPIAKVLRAAYLAASLAKGLRQIQQPPKSPRAPQPMALPRGARTPIAPLASTRRAPKPPASSPWHPTAQPVAAAPKSLGKGAHTPAWRSLPKVYPAKSKPPADSGPTLADESGGGKKPWDLASIWPLGPGAKPAFPSAPKNGPSGGREEGKTSGRLPKIQALRRIGSAANKKSLRPLAHSSTLKDGEERGKKPGLRFRDGGGQSGGEESEKDEKLDNMLDQVKEANRLLKELIAAVKEKPPGQPNGPDDDNESPMDGPGSSPSKSGGDWGRKAMDAVQAGEGMAELDGIVAEFAPLLAAL